MVPNPENLLPVAVVTWAAACTRAGQLAEEALRLRPRLRVLFTTGYTRNAIVHHGRLDPGVHLLTKPYSYQELAKKVRERLES